MTRQEDILILKELKTLQEKLQRQLEECKTKKDAADVERILHYVEHTIAGLKINTDER